jgi:hypothetical protein
VALDVDQVAAVLVRRGVPEVVEADLVERRRRLEAGDVAAELRGLLVRAQDGRHGVPADRGPQVVLDLLVARDGLLLVDRDRVDVRRGEIRRDARAAPARPVEHAGDDLLRPARAVVRDHRVQGFKPFRRLLGIDVRRRRDTVGRRHPPSPFARAHQPYHLRGERASRSAPVQTPDGA